MSQRATGERAGHTPINASTIYTVLTCQLATHHTLHRCLSHQQAAKTCTPTCTHTCMHTHARTHVRLPRRPTLADWSASPLTHMSTRMSTCACMTCTRKQQGIERGSSPVKRVQQPIVDMCAATHVAAQLHPSMTHIPGSTHRRSKLHQPSPPTLHGHQPHPPSL